MCVCLLSLTCAVRGVCGYDAHTCAPTTPATVRGVSMAVIVKSRYYYCAWSVVLLVHICLS